MPKSESVELSQQSKLCRFCARSLEGRRPNVEYCNQAHRQAYYRRKVDPGIGSPDRQTIMRDAFLETQSLQLVSRDLHESGIMRCANENEAPPSRRPKDFRSKPPEDAFNPNYEIFQQESLLYDGLVVTETVRLEDTYRDWVDAGRPAEGVPTIVERTRALRVHISELNLTEERNIHLDRIVRENAKRRGVQIAEREWPMTKEVIERLERLEKQANRILVRLGDDEAIGELIEDWRSEATSCGVEVFKP